MTPKRRPTPTAWRPRRDRREVAVAVVASAGLVVATVVAIAIMAPRDNNSSEPTGITIPTTTSVSPTTTTAAPPTP